MRDPIRMRRAENKVELLWSRGWQHWKRKYQSSQDNQRKRN